MLVSTLHLRKRWISQAQSSAVAQNKKKDEVDEETLDPNVSLSNQALSGFFSSLHKPNTCALLFCACIILKFANIIVPHNSLR